MAKKKDAKDRLSDRFIRTVTESGTYGDGGRGGRGLELRVFVRANGVLSKVFQQRLRVNGKQITVGIGEYPTVLLEMARDIAFENAQLARNGIDPSPGKDEEKNEKDVPPTFTEAAELVIAERSKTWKNDERGSRRSWRGSIEKHALPKIGDKRMDEITEDDIIEILKPLWNSGKSETAHRLLGRTKIVFNWCIRNYRQLEIVNPVTGFVHGHAPQTKKKVKHFRSVFYNQMGGALMAIRVCGSKPTTKLAQEFQIYTACRHGSVRKASWSEIDWENRIWTIPDENMKMERPHRVPLSTGAMAVLKKAFPLKKEDSDLIFPSLDPQNSSGVISEDTLGTMCRRLGLSGVPHGFRSTFGTWCGEKGVPQELAEAALAHVPGEVVRAYTRTDYLERRKPLMQAWSDYIEGKLPDNWRWREGDDELMNAFADLQKLFAEAQRELAELRAELAALKAA